ARVFVLLPETYMNLSGEAMAAAAGMYKIPVRNIIVVHDDLDLEPGEVRVKDGGGAGGHRGLESCVLVMGSADFLRVRIGIGRHDLMDSSDYVLSRISQEHAEALRDAAQKAGSAIETIIKKGAQPAMNRFNRRRKKRKEKQELEEGEGTGDAGDGNEE
ncbi:MAG: aminoacyl-tRNA hydrolase, partial [Pseudomonadota bacterium]